MVDLKEALLDLKATWPIIKAEFLDQRIFFRARINHEWQRTEYVLWLKHKNKKYYLSGFVRANEDYDHYLRMLESWPKKAIRAMKKKLNELSLDQS